jgi:hypothetical protein
MKAPKINEYWFANVGSFSKETKECKIIDVPEKSDKDWLTLEYLVQISNGTKYRAKGSDFTNIKKHGI